MKIALVGYGKMGKEIEKIALDRGHEISVVIDVNNPEAFESREFAASDVAIEFTIPEVAYGNFLKCFEAGVPVVSGSTGWLDKREELENMVLEKKHGFFYASNFSLGVNIFFMMNKHLAKIMNHCPDYRVSMDEVHHTQKLDSPSGTAITLAEGIVENIERKSGWVEGQSASGNDVEITAHRREKVPGIHTIKYDSDVDFIEMTHSAKSRKGFALGAVLAAEFMAGKSGVYGMEDMLKF